MPAARPFPLDKLLAGLEEYHARTGRKALVQYIMLGGVNDQLSHAHELGALLKGRPCVRLYCFPVSSADSIVLVSCVQRWTQENSTIAHRCCTCTPLFATSCNDHMILIYVPATAKAANNVVAILKQVYCGSQPHPIQPNRS
eukprot:SAG31_NODE_73_length_27793_cov_26.900520_11_plen_142_part_00